MKQKGGLKLERKRLNRIQNLAHEITDEMNKKACLKDCPHAPQVIDLLSRAIGSLSDPTGHVSLDYVEEKITKTHYLLFKNEKKLSAYRLK
jgi:hypothetical protein